MLQTELCRNVEGVTEVGTWLCVVGAYILERWQSNVIYLPFNVIKVYFEVWWDEKLAVNFGLPRNFLRAKSTLPRSRLSSVNFAHNLVVRGDLRNQTKLKGEGRGTEGLRNVRRASCRDYEHSTNNRSCFTRGNLRSRTS